MCAKISTAFNFSYEVMINSFLFFFVISSKFCQNLLSFDLKIQIRQFKACDTPNSSSLKYVIKYIMLLPSSCGCVSSDQLMFSFQFIILDYLYLLRKYKTISDYLFIYLCYHLKFMDCSALLASVASGFAFMDAIFDFMSVGGVRKEYQHHIMHFLS